MFKYKRTNYSVKYINNIKMKRRRHQMWKICWDNRKYNMQNHFRIVSNTEKIIPYENKNNDPYDVFKDKKSTFNTHYKKTLCFIIHLKLNGQKRFIKFKK